ncbi:Small GTP-binding protein domain [Trinorchestia longiramus]|nr:Small GTP-binding protein domain [Trinorchestia longiramus]
MPERSRKIAVMGYQSVGKSTLCIQFVEGHFVDNYDPTIENTFHKNLKVRGEDYTLELVDTAGQDEYSSFPAQYSMGIHGYVLVYSITNDKSFQVVQNLYHKLLNMIGKVTVPVVLVGNKTDLQKERVVSTEEGKRVADVWGAMFIETTAKRRDIVSDVFTKAVLEIEKSEGSLPADAKCVVS